jgi:hypothetical protein
MIATQKIECTTQNIILILSKNIIDKRQMDSISYFILKNRVLGCFFKLAAASGILIKAATSKCNA